MISRINFPHIVYVQILAGGFLLGACAAPDNSYFPLQTGYVWHYQIQSTTMEGVENQKYYVRNVKPQVIDNTPAFVQQSLTGLRILFQETQAGMEQIGYLVPRGAEEEFIMDKLLILPAVLETGTEWESIATTRTLKKKGAVRNDARFQIMAAIPVTNRVESTEAVVSVPAGRFNNCIEIHTEGFSFHSGGPYIDRILVEIKQTRWYAPGVGLVKSLLQETSTDKNYSKGEWLMQLESYKQH